MNYFDRPKWLIFIGWVSALCFMMSGAPSAYEAYMTKTQVVNIGTLFLWTFGEICAILYVLPTKDKPLLVNYTVNLIFLSIIWFYTF